jgi:hypothetical protein
VCGRCRRKPSLTAIPLGRPAWDWRRHFTPTLLKPRRKRGLVAMPRYWSTLIKRMADDAGRSFHLSVSWIYCRRGGDHTGGIMVTRVV